MRQDDAFLSSAAPAALAFALPAFFSCLASVASRFLVLCLFRLADNIEE